VKRYVFAHVIPAVLYGLVLVGLAVVRGGGIATPELLGYVQLVLGVFTGSLVLFLDRVVYVFSYPEEQLSQHFKYLWKGKKRGEALSLIYTRRSEQQRLTFRSALFMAMWVPVAFFALTSTAGLFGKGVVMGLMFHILYDAWRLQNMDPTRLNTRLFWQVRRGVSREEQVTFMWIMTIVFGFFSFWVR